MWLRGGASAPDAWVLPLPSSTALHKTEPNRETVVDVDVEKSGIWTVLGDRNGAHAVENSLASSQKTKTERLRVLSSSTSEHRPGKF